MAIINKTGITNGGTIQAEHVTRVIDALSGVSTDTLIISGTMTGSLIGSLTGTASFATNAINVAVTDTTSGTGPYYLMFADGTTGNRAARVDSNTLTFNATTNLLTATSSYANQALSSSFATTASFAANASSFPFTGSARITGSLTVSGSTILSGSRVELVGNAQFTNWVASRDSIINWSMAGSSGNGQFILPSAAPTSPVLGSMYFNGTSLSIYDGSVWQVFIPG
jgi:hypothetical protein